MTTLNLLGTEIWKICEGRTEEEIVSALLDGFEVEPDLLRSDVAAFLSELAEKKYISYV
jgi:GeoRSP system PqqD family protein